MRNTIRLQPKLQLKQKLALSPKVMLALKLAQKNRIELRKHIAEQLECNPMLELASDATTFDSGSDVPDSYENDNPRSLDFNSDTAANAEGHSFRDEGYEPNDQRSSHESQDTGSIQSSQSDTAGSEPYRDSDIAPSGLKSQSSEAPDFDAFIAHPEESSMRYHLMQKAMETPFTDDEHSIAVAIIHSIDDDGYLRDSIKCIQQALAPAQSPTQAEIERVLQVIQSFEPAGLGARNLPERLIAQIEASESNAEIQQIAIELVSTHLEWIAQSKLTALVRATRFNRHQIHAAIELIHSVDPDPAARFFDESEIFILPEARIVPTPEGWEVRIHKDLDPDLRICESNYNLMERARGKDKAYMNKHLEAARDLIGALEIRNQTFRKILAYLVAHQGDFLRCGKAKLQILLQKDVAEALEMSESTVSRTVKGKFVETPRGIIELKHFFTHGIASKDGDLIASDAVKARLQELVRDENPARPLSDEQLAKILVSEGVVISRRAIAKYRSQLAIPNSSKRKRHQHALNRANKAKPSYAN